MSICFGMALCSSEVPVLRAAEHASALSVVGARSRVPSGSLHVSTA